MDADGDDPEPGAPVQRALFYGLWPRFTTDEPDPADADSLVGTDSAVDVWRGGDPHRT